MAKLNTEDLLGQFKEMTLVELSEFVKSFEKEFDVTAAAPVAAAAAGGAAAAGAEAAQDEFSVILEEAGSAKIAVINSRKRIGDVTKVAGITGFSTNFVSEVLNGLYRNDRIVNKAFNMTRGRKTNMSVIG